MGDIRSLPDVTLDQVVVFFMSFISFQWPESQRENHTACWECDVSRWNGSCLFIYAGKRARKPLLTTISDWHCGENKNTDTRWAASSLALPLSVKTPRSDSTQPLLHSKSLQYAEWHVCTFASGMKQIVGTRASSSRHSVTFLRESAGNKKHIKTVLVAWQEPTDTLGFWFVGLCSFSSTL